MKKEDKGLIINKIAETLKEYSGFYLVETAGLNAEKTSALRRACAKSDIKLMVVKNTLLHKALEATEGDFQELYPVLKGSTSVMFTNVGNAPAKLLKDFVKKDDVLPCLKASRPPRMWFPHLPPEAQSFTASSKPSPKKKTNNKLSTDTNKKIILQWQI